VSDTAAHYLVLVSGRKRGLVAGLQRCGLQLASWPYGWSMWVRNRLYDREWRVIEKASTPVVSVGNLTVGGTGKTPCVEYIARFLSDGGQRVAILSRGYGSAGGASDEALVLEENLPDVPHLIGADRAELAKTAIEELESDVLILDDGFQHRRLARTLDLVLIDATRPWGFGHMLPRGLLRESPRELRRSHAVILTRCDLASEGEIAAIRDRVAKLAPQVPVLESEHRPLEWVNSEGRRLPLNQLQKGMAFCGIGNPEGFFQTLQRLGFAIDDRRLFPDHHRYSRGDVESLAEWAEKQPAGAFMVTTQKDLVKLRINELGGRGLWALKIGLSIRQGEERLHELLNESI
jgi:tetraacyldisaccharide 4'-kinase